MERAARLAPLAFVALVLVAPWVTAPPGPPSLGATAAQLLPPRTRVQEAPLQGGGYVRALGMEPAGDGLRLLVEREWRTFDGIHAAGPIVTRRLWLGSDQHGRDVLARIAHGARASLIVAAIATLSAVLLGTAGGLGAALLPGFPGVIVRRAVDVLLGLPRLLLLLVLGVTFRGSLGGVGLAIGLASWMEISRLVEGEARSLGKRPFVAAVRATGAGPLRLGLRHMLPNLAPLLIVASPLIATDAILIESTLAYLGVDAGAGASSWGRIVADGQRWLPGAWWMTVFPGLLLCLTALAVHALARGEIVLHWFGPRGRARVPSLRAGGA